MNKSHMTAGTRTTTVMFFVLALCATAAMLDCYWTFARASTTPVVQALAR